MAKEKYTHNFSACYENCLNFDIENCEHCKQIVKNIMFISIKELWRLFDETNRQGEYWDGARHGLLLAMSAFTEEDKKNG